MVWEKLFQEKFSSSISPSQLVRSRFLHTSGPTSLQFTTTNCGSNKPAAEVTPSNQPPTSSDPPGNRILGGIKGKPTALDKIFLVGSGRFKSKNEIPSMLDSEVILKARSWGRIRINIGFLILTAAGGGLMVYLGKRAASRGDATIEQQNLDWHRQIKEEYESEQRKKQN